MLNMTKGELREKRTSMLHSVVSVSFAWFSKQKKKKKKKNEKKKHSFQN